MISVTKTIVIPAKTIELTMAQFIGRKIRQRRVELGLTMYDLKPTMSPAYASDIEHGRRKIGFEKLYLLSKHLKVSMDWFVDGWES